MTYQNRPVKTKKKHVQPYMLANIIIVGVMFITIAICLVTMERPTKSDIENRMLATFPEFSLQSLFSGEYTDSISNYFNDTVPNRDAFKNAAANIRKAFGISFGDTKVYGPVQIVDTTPAPTTDKPVTDDPSVTTDPNQSGDGTTSPVTEQTTPATTAKQYGDEIAEGVYTNGQIVVYQDGHYRGISMFGGGSGDTYATALNNFKNDLGSSVNVYSMVVPTSGAYYTPSNFSQYNASHLDCINAIAAKLSGVTNVDAYSVLGNHLDEPIYTRTDHHWQPLGAYYAAQEFAKTAGVDFADLSTYKKVTVEGYVGTLYSFTQSAELLNDPEDFVYYKPQNDYTTYYYNTSYEFDYEFPLFVEGMPVSGSYSTFMGGDSKIVRIETDVKNGRKLIIFKDSYGNAEVPFYTGSFEEIIVCDIRYFDLNAIQFIKNMGCTDVLFSMCTFSAVGVNADHIDKIRTQ